MTKMQTQYVTTIALDEDRLAKDLEQSAAFRYSEAYSNYLIGGPWKSVVLWGAGGDSGTGVLSEYTYDQPAAFTEYGDQLPYLGELITNTVDLTRLQFVRLAVISDSVIVPHRDYLELTDTAEGARWAHRLHIPLITHENCLFSEDNVVYRMLPGEAWFFDAGQIHSVVSLSNATRIHLIFDFDDQSDGSALVKVGQQGRGNGIPVNRRVDRPPLADFNRASLLRLADMLTMDNFREVFSIIIKTHFRWDGGENFAWDTMTGVARACKDPAVLPHTLEMLRYYTLDRSGSKE